MLGRLIRSVASPDMADWLSDLQIESLVEDAAIVAHDSTMRIAALLERAPGSCSAQQLQLAFNAAWEAARQLPLMVSGAAVGSAFPEEERRSLGGLALFALQPLIAAALQLAVPPASNAAGNSQAPSQEDVAAAIEVLQRTHSHLCKMAHFLAAAAPAEQQRGVQTALAAANPALSSLLADCFTALQRAFAQGGGSSRHQSEEGAADGGQDG